VTSSFVDRIHAYLPGWDVPKMETSLFTTHFGLVSDFLSECWTQLRQESRLAGIRDRVTYGGALSGRDATAVNRTVDGLLKLLYPDRTQVVGEEELEWAVRLALECRRRVKEQQKRVGSAEFRNTHFSYQLGDDGVERFVVTPEVQSEDEIGSDPLPPGQVWAISPGGQDEGVGSLPRRCQCHLAWLRGAHHQRAGARTIPRECALRGAEPVDASPRARGRP